jgi:hypothetical protein
MTPIGFDSWKQYFRFSLAREFVDCQTAVPFTAHTRLEKAGDFMAKIVVKPLDLAIREFRNPAVIAALTITLLAATTIAFYPAQSLLIAYKVLPFLKAIKAHHITAALFAITQTTIVGLGIRTVARLSNAELMQKYHAKEIFPITIGTVKIK